MKISQGGRGSGKTYTLVQLSHLSDYPIMTRNRCSKKYIQMMADQLGLTIPEPIVFRNKQDTRGKLLPTDKVLVDDLDGWLSDIVSDYFGSAVTAATMNIDDNQNVINLMDEETKHKCMKL